LSVKQCIGISSSSSGGGGNSSIEHRYTNYLTTVGSFGVLGAGRGGAAALPPPLWIPRVTY